MKRVLLYVALVLLLVAPVSHAGFFDDLTRGLGLSGAGNWALDEGTIVRGLKEALATGTDRAVKSVARTDGYYGNQAIRILMPEKIRNVADVLGQIGFKSEVDAFVLGMNRAAEKAAPKAVEYFVSALKEMPARSSMEAIPRPPSISGARPATRSFRPSCRSFPPA